ncbi:MAG: PorP/SprF family type IX secretion system membrane protein [Bacteroidia bacterium]|nr:PorP/SprF family type IX secretion system membrane protein [Bacteroidia bacterium]
MVFLRKVYLIAIVIAFTLIKAQDIHFSQFNGSLLNLNPAFTGFFNGDYRVGAIYRSQWQSVPVPYSTISMSGESRFRPSSQTRDAAGIGILFNSDVAGDARYGTTQLYLSGSYIYNAKEDSSLQISMGLNLGYCSVGFDYNRMTFDNQYDGLNYYKNAATGENFQWTRYNFGDFNLGVAAQYILNNKHRIIYGISANHLTSPNITYQGNDVSKLDFKLGNYVSFITPISLKDDVVAELLYNRQGKYNELIPHVSIKHYLNKDANQAILGGLSFRAKDAIILRAGYTFKNLQSGIAYDINISKFTAATNRRGAFEIFVTYIMFKKYQTVIKTKPCPVFM